MYTFKVVLIFLSAIMGIASFFFVFSSYHEEDTNELILWSFIGIVNLMYFYSQTSDKD